MHPLLPFYAGFSLIALVSLQMRDSAERSVIWLAAWGAMGTVLIAAAFRPISGDTWRYNRALERIRGQPLLEALSDADGNYLFSTVSWLLGQLGSSPWWLFAPITFFCGFMLWYSLRQVLSPLHVVIAILLYSVYPYFIFYIASGIKQALAMAFLLQGYIALYKRRRSAAIWIGIAPLFHSGAALVLPFLAVHWVIWRPRFGHRRALQSSLTLLFLTIAASITNLNQALLGPLQELFTLSDRYDLYFEDAGDYGYRAGFRPDFTVFSLLPLMAAWWLRNKGRGLTADVSGWWLNLYILLACIYQLFAFAPFADRFATFGWYLIPFILLVMLAESGRRRDLQLLVLILSLFNILILQFYTGKTLHFVS